MLGAAHTPLNSGVSRQQKRSLILARRDLFVTPSLSIRVLALRVRAGIVGTAAFSSATPSLARIAASRMPASSASAALFRRVLHKIRRQVFG